MKIVETTLFSAFLTVSPLTSDNGCAPYIGAKELEAKGHYPSGPLRGYKADAWEGGHRIPFIVRWPGIVKPGSLCHQLVEQTDLIRTFADMKALLEKLITDGRSTPGSPQKNDVEVKRFPAKAAATPTNKAKVAK